MLLLIHCLLLLPLFERVLWLVFVLLSSALLFFKIVLKGKRELVFFPLGPIPAKSQTSTSRLP